VGSQIQPARLVRGKCIARLRLTLPSAAEPTDVDRNFTLTSGESVGPWLEWLEGFRVDCCPEKVHWATRRCWWKVHAKAMKRCCTGRALAAPNHGTTMYYVLLRQREQVCALERLSSNKERKQTITRVEVHVTFLVCTHNPSLCFLHSLCSDSIVSPEIL
jgi:hypothetical protein